MTLIRRSGFPGVLAAALVLAVATSAAAEPKREAREGRASRPGRESERETKIRKAREEIRKNPAQRKFILFRYGLSDGDVAK